MENVKGILTMAKGQVVEKIKRMLDNPNLSIEDLNKLQEFIGLKLSVFTPDVLTF